MENSEIVERLFLSVLGVPQALAVSSLLSALTCTNSSPEACLGSIDVDFYAFNETNRTVKMAGAATSFSHDAPAF